MKTKKLFTEPGNLTAKELVEMSTPQLLSHIPPWLQGSSRLLAQSTAQLLMYPSSPTHRSILLEEVSPYHQWGEEENVIPENMLEDHSD